jgi:hypothetical protein
VDGLSALVAEPCRTPVQVSPSGGDQPLDLVIGRNRLAGTGFDRFPAVGDGPFDGIADRRLGCLRPKGIQPFQDIRPFPEQGGALDRIISFRDFSKGVIEVELLQGVQDAFAFGQQ